LRPTEYLSPKKSPIEISMGGFMNRMRFWPLGALIVLAVAVIAAIAAAVLFKYQRSAQASELPNAARIERVEGQVGINQSSDNSANAQNSQWIAATANMPVGVGDRIYTKDNSRSEIAFTGRNFATVDANTSLDVLELSGARTQVALRGGSGLFDVGSIPSGGLFEVATPCGAVDLQQPGLYQIAINDNGNATATAFSGQAQVIGHAGSGSIQKGESLSVSCQDGAAANLSRVEPNQAGTVVDNYYRYRYPKTYDGRYRSYYTYLDDPYYYDPARRYTSYNYVNQYMPGIDDLDDYGDWQYVSDYGYVWHPRTSVGWAPYQSGSWTMDYPYGLTWVSSEPWGYAPYHYGRWAYTSNEWYWVPGSTAVYPTYSPALVAFLPLGQSSVAWVALGPSDPYVTRYYDANWQPEYVYPSSVVVDRVVNIGVPGAVTVVPAQDFVGVIDPRVIQRVDPQTFVQVRPVLDPLTVDPLRRAAFQTREARARFDVPREVEQRFNTPVVASNLPAAPPFRRDLARSLKVEPVADRVRSQKLQISDQRSNVSQQAAQQTNIAAEQARERQMADLARQAARGDRNARQQLQELRKQPLAPQATAGARVAGQAQAERVAQPVQPQQSQRAALRQQQQEQREAARQQMITSQQQQRAARHSQQQQVVRPQAPAQRKENKPPQYQRPAQPRMITPAQPQVRAQPNRGQVERRAAPQSQPVRPPQAQAKPQAQPKPQAVRQPQAQQPQKAPEQKGGAKKKPPES
jgi:hypothetical protein